ncbi:MAG TPA: hypothetical protein VLI04_11690 [Nocardioidaceae bacterium]|nr:hypothetical protein [Nocardioidaceae bacterium]
MTLIRNVPASRNQLTAVALLVVLAGGLGFYVGANSAWGTKEPHVSHGTAMRANSANDLIMFDADDGEQVDFGARSIWWESSSASGDGNPPCLRMPQEKVPVDVGWMWVANPSGGSHREAVWVRCP